ncbi:nucleoporin NUP42-like isoform X2 [Patiria miniata]|uniref:Nucleoporin NUP42 n=1 Tax=Patiria miniata TaxID=46514 RepID=A0A913ZKD4_PATMI|nr:nucleoporin NUP42-like isoform X2 [Patiria miniata]
MVVCKYYMKGDCKFGNQCRFEHPRGGSGGGYSGYGGGGYQSYGGGGSYGSRGSGNYGNNGQQQSNYKNPYVYHKDTSGGRNYDGRGQGGGGGGGGGGTKKVVFRDSFGSFGGNQNQFGALSNLSDQTPNDDIKEQDILDAIKHDIDEWEGSKIWPLSSYRPNKSRCGCVPGFEDISPDEVRFLAYTAEKENKFDQHKASFASVLGIYKRQRDMLRKPSTDMKAQLINVFRGGQTSGSIFGNTESTVQILYSTLPGGSSQALGASTFGSTSTGFGSKSSSNSSGFGGGTFGNTQPGNLGGTFGTQGQSGGGASAGLFGKPASTGATGTGLFGKPASTGTTGTGLFGKPASDGTTGTGLFGKPVAVGINDSGGSSGMFGSGGSTGQTGLFGKPAAFGSSQSSSFGMTQGDFGSSSSGGAGASSRSQGSTYTPLSELTPEEKEQFEATSFTLGKVPSRPPPMELCR